uniref:Uncharacterized protein n=1 Tax=Rhizophora mucronata TaxID=61149 RepID=A0A2P2N3C0_RHIMU
MSWFLDTNTVIERAVHSSLSFSVSLIPKHRDGHIFGAADCFVGNADNVEAQIMLGTWRSNPFASLYKIHTS